MTQTLSREQIESWRNCFGGHSEMAEFNVLCDRLELRKAQLETLLAQAGTAVAPVALHTATAKRFAADMAALGQAITEAQAEGDATLTAALRTMVTTVTVHRNYELEITGNLAPLTRGEEMVAGERLDCFPPATLVIPFIITAAA